jgi:hypothetical protein
MKVPGMYWLMPNVSLFANQDGLDHSSSNTTNLSSAHSPSAANANNSSITLPPNNTNAAAVATTDNHSTASENLAHLSGAPPIIMVDAALLLEAILF